MLLFLFAAFWLWHLSSVALSPPVDAIEQLIWVRSLEWGYYKHPPLPTWLLGLSVSLLGWNAWAAYLTGALCTLAALWFMASVVRAIEGPRTAWLCVLAALCITFYNGRLYYYNHNIVLMLFVSLSAWVWWRLRTRPSLWAWVALGVVSAAGMLSKYQFALVLMAGAGFFFQTGMWRERAHWRGVLWAMGVAVLLCAPHALWLLTSQNSPIQYAMTSSLGVHLDAWARLQTSTQFLLDWVFNRCLFAVLLLLAVRGLGAVLPKTDSDGDLKSHPGRALLLWWGVFPPVAMGLMGLIWGVEQQLQWGTAFALWTVPALAWVFGLKERRLQGTRWLLVAVVVWGVAQAAVFFHSWQTSAFGAHPSNPPHWRQFDSQALADDVLPGVRAQTHQPVRVVRSNSFALSGALALRMAEQPKVWIEGDPRVSPWLTAEDLSGPVLRIWEPGESAPPDVVRTPSGRFWRLDSSQN